MTVRLNAIHNFRSSLLLNPGPLPLVGDLNPRKGIIWQLKANQLDLEQLGRLKSFIGSLAF